MLAIHNVSPQRRVNTGLKSTTTGSSSCKQVLSHCSSDSDSSQELPQKRFRFDANYCGLESTLRKMNVEQDGENSPEELPASSFLANFGPNRKRQSSLSFSPTKNNNINNNSQSAAGPNRATASRSSKSSSNAYLQKQQITSSQNGQNSQNSQNPQNPQNHQNQANTPQFQNQQLFNKNYNAQGEQFSTPKSSNQLNEHQSSSSNFESTSIEPVEVSSPLKKSFEKKFNYKRRLKHLPSQQHLSNSQLAKHSLNKSPSSISLKTTGNRLHLADALNIFEEMLGEREEKLKEEFHLELQGRLAEQYEQFVRYNEDAVRSKFDNSCSYLS